MSETCKKNHREPRRGVIIVEPTKQKAFQDPSGAALPRATMTYSEDAAPDGAERSQSEGTYSTKMPRRWRSETFSLAACNRTWLFFFHPSEWPHDRRGNYISPA